MSLDIKPYLALSEARIRTQFKSGNEELDATLVDAILMIRRMTGELTASESAAALIFDTLQRDSRVVMQWSHKRIAEVLREWAKIIDAEAAKPPKEGRIR